MGSNVAIRSTGIFVPEVEVPNSALRERFAKKAPDYVDKMESATGIRTRFHAPESWATSDLAVKAAEQALAIGGVDAKDVDLIVVGTDTPDYITPATSVVVQHKLGSPNAGTYDVGCACASFPTALATANGLMLANPWMKNVLVVGAYMMQRLCDPDDLGIFFYGDGAGAALLVRSEQQGIHQSAFRADGRYAKHWGIYSGGTAEPVTQESFDAGRTTVRIVERFPPETNDEGWPAIARALCERNGFAMTDVDLVLLTQVRKRTIEKVMAAIDVPMEKTHMVMQKWGYTGSACIPMVLHDAVAMGKAKVGDRILLVGSGVGYNQAGIAITLTNDLCHGTPSRSA